MNELILQPTRSSSSAIKVAPLWVHLDGWRRRDLFVTSIDVLEAPHFGKAVVELAMSGLVRPERRSQDLHALPAVGSRLQIRLPEPLPRVLFDGCVTRHLAALGPQGEQLTAEAEDLLALRLNGPLGGRWQSRDDAATFVPTGDLTFNGEDGLASSGTFPINARSCRVFQPGAQGQSWSVADILKYLLAAGVGADIADGGLDPYDSFARSVYPPRLALSGLTVGEAIVRTAELAGLVVRGALDDAGGQHVRRGLVFYRPGVEGSRRSVRLQPAGQTLDVRQSNLHQATISVRRRPGRRGVVLLGELKRYESTFVLKRGWDRTKESYHYRDFVRSESSDWPTVADVFRRWVLNESGAYSADPYRLPGYDFSALGADFLVPAARRLEPCLSRDASGHSQGIVVEVSYDSGSTWKRYPGAARVVCDECAIYLADDALSADYFQAARDSAAVIRVTATVASDRRLTAEIAGDPGAGRRALQFPSAQWAKVASGSIFRSRSDLPAPAERDDSQRLMQMARAFSESPGATVEAELTLAWLDHAFDVGDIISGIDGRGLQLPVFPGASPSIRAVEHRPDLWTTRLVVRG